MSYDRTRITDFSLALKAMDQCLEENDEKHVSAWKHTTINEHLQHADAHATDYSENPNYDDLRSNALRSLMALEVYERSQQD